MNASKYQQTIEFDFCYTTQPSNSKTEMNSGAPEVLAFRMGENFTPCKLKPEVHQCRICRNINQEEDNTRCLTCIVQHWFYCYGNTVFFSFRTNIATHRWPIQSCMGA